MVDPQEVAGAALRRPASAARVIGRAPMAYDPFLAGRSVEHVEGTAEMAGGAVLRWTAIVKRTSGGGLRAARRELSAYRAGIASAQPDSGLRGPALLAWMDERDLVELWLEEVADDHGGAWPIERYGVAAHHIGSWNARTALVTLPADFDSEDRWAERHGQPDRVAEALDQLGELVDVPAAAGVEGLLGRGAFERVAALIASTPRRLELLALQPVTLLHHDLVRSNLFAIGDHQTVVIDWENVGRGPLGVDLAPLVIGSVRRGEASSDDIARLESVVLAGYTAGLRDAGVADVGQVGEAYRLAVGLRWHVVLGTISALVRPESAGFRGSRPAESRAEAMRHLVELSRHILDVGLASLDRHDPG